MRKLFLLLCAVCLLSACGSSERKYYTRTIEAEPIYIHRFDLDLIRLDTTRMHASIQALYAKHPEFMPVFLENVLGMSSSDTGYVVSVIPNFLADTLFQSVHRKVIETFTDIAHYEQEVGNAFARLQYFYPNAEIPELYFFVSGFSRTFTMHNGLLAVGSDMYLGADYPYYNRVVYEYMRYTMRPDCIPIDMVSAYLFNHFQIGIDRVRLLDDMMYRGKLMYFLSVLFPSEKLSEIIGYTQAQWAWCDEFEREIWGTVLDRKDLFTTDYRTIASYMNDAPFTSPISEESPGRVGTWIGMRIVASYMENNPQVSMQELLAQTDAQSILEQSGYRP